MANTEISSALTQPFETKRLNIPDSNEGVGYLLKPATNDALFENVQRKKHKIKHLHLFPIEKKIKDKLQNTEI